MDGSPSAKIPRTTAAPALPWPRSSTGLQGIKTGKEAEKIDGYTPEQRCFLGFGRVWCEKRRPEVARMRVLTDPHSPGKYRVDGVV